MKERKPSEDDTPKPIKLKQVYGIRDIIKQKYRDQIKAEIPYEPSDKSYIGSYQRAVTTIHENLTTSELEEVEEMVEIWNKKGAPPEVQRK